MVVKRSKDFAGNDFYRRDSVVFTVPFVPIDSSVDKITARRDVFVGGDRETFANLWKISPNGSMRSSIAIAESEIADAADGFSVVHKFGKNDAIGTTVKPICLGGVWQMPQVANATTLRVKAGNANDTAGG